MESSIILCCINPLDCGTAITNEILFELFAAYGDVQEVLIFSRKVLIKAFVEFANPEIAQKILSTQISAPPSFGKIKLYKSHKRSILRKTSQPADIGPEDENDGTNNSVTSLGCQPNPLRDYNLPPLSHNEFSNYISSMKSFEESYRNDSLPYPRARNFTLQDFSKFEALKDTEDKYNTLSFNNLEDTRGRPLNNRGTDEPRVLMVNRLNFNYVTCVFLNNLFGCFGNVTKILLNRSDSYALIEFENGTQACSSSTALKDRSFFGNPLKLKLSKYTSLNFKSLEKDDESRKLDFLYGNSKNFRFSTGFGGVKNPPTKSLHLEGLSADVTPLILFELTGQIHEPEKICQLSRQQFEDKSFLVEFSTETQAMEVLAVLQGKLINGKPVKVSFSQN